MGHVDICYPRPGYFLRFLWPSLRALVWAIGDGVLLKANREKYIELCKRESQKTLFAYGLSLSEQQKKPSEERLERDRRPLDTLGSQVLAAEQRREGEVKHTYSYPTETQRLMRHSISSHHLNLKPTLFSSTNCVLLADSIVGEAGTDILSPKGFIVPGTYQGLSGFRI